MVDIADLRYHVNSAELARANRELDRNDRANRKSAGSLSGVGAAAARAVAPIAAIASTGLGISSLVSTNADFADSMARVQAIAGATEGEFDLLREAAKNLGATTEFSASEAAGGMQFLAQAGFDASEVLEAIPTVLDLATASATDMATAGDILSNIMSGFSVEASKAAEVADILAATAASSNTNLGQLGNAMSYVAPLAASAGLSIAETASAVGVLSDAGIQGSRAGTSLSGILRRLQSPSDKAAAVLQQLGLRMEDVDLKGESLTDVLVLLGNANLSLAQATALFEAEAAPGALVLAKNAARARELEQALGLADGALAEMAKTMRDTLRGDISGVRSAFEGLLIVIGDAGATDALRSGFQGLASALRFVSKNIDVALPLAGALAAGIAAIAFPVTTTAIALAGLTTGAIYLATQLAPVQAAISAIKERFILLGPTLSSAGDALRAVFAGDWRKALDKGRDALEDFSDWVGDVFSDIGDAAAEYIGPLVDTFRDSFPALASTFDVAANKARLFLSGVRDALSGLAPVAQSALSAVGAAFRGDWQGALDHAREALASFKDWWDSLSFSSDITTYFEGLTSFWYAYAGALTESFIPALNSLKSAWDSVKASVGNITSALSSLIQAVSGRDDAAFGLSDIGRALGQLAGLALEGVARSISLVAGAVEALTGAIADIAENPGEAISELADGLSSNLAGLAGDALDWAKDIGLSVLAGIGNGLAEIGTAIVEFSTELKAEIDAIAARALNWAKDIGANVIEGVKAGLRERLPGLNQAFKNMGDASQGGLRREWGIQSPSRVFAEIGGYAMDGLTLGIEDRKLLAVSAMQRAAKDIADPIEKLALRLDWEEDLIGATDEQEQLIKELASTYRELGDAADRFSDAEIEAMAKRAVAIDDAKERVEDLRDLWTDFAEDAAEVLVDGISGGFKGIWQGFKSLISSMVSEAAKVSLTNLFTGGNAAGGLGNVLGALGGVGKSIGGFFGQISAGFGAVWKGLTTGGLSGAFTGITSSLGSLGTAIGALAGPIGIAIGLFSAFKSKSKLLDSGLQATIDGFDAVVETFKKVEKSRLFGLIKSKKTSTGAADAAVADPIRDAVAEVQGQIVDMAEALGVGAGAFENFSHSFKLSLKDLSEDEQLRAIEAEITKLGDAFAGQVPGLKQYAAAGEGAAATLARLSSSFTSVAAILEQTGFGVERFAGSLNTLGQAAISDELAGLFGGVDSMAAALSQFNATMRTEADNLRITSDNVTAALDGIGQSLPGSRQALVDLVEGLDLTTAAGREAFAIFTQLTPQIDQIYTAQEAAADALADAAQRLADEQTVAASTSDQLASSVAKVTEEVVDSFARMEEATGGFTAAWERFVSAFYSDSEQANYAAGEIRTAMAELGYVMPGTAEGFRNLVEEARRALDVLRTSAGTTEVELLAAEERLAGLLALSDEYANLARLEQSLADEQQQRYEAEQRAAEQAAEAQQRALEEQQRAAQQVAEAAERARESFAAAFFEPARQLSAHLGDLSGALAGISAQVPRSQAELVALYDSLDAAGRAALDSLTADFQSLFQLQDEIARIEEQRLEETRRAAEDAAAAERALADERLRSIEAFGDAFFSAGRQFTDLSDSIGAALNQLGIEEIPQTRAALVALFDGLGESAQAALAALTSDLSEYYNALEADEQDRQRAAAEAAREAEQAEQERQRAIEEAAREAEQAEQERARERERIADSIASLMEQTADRRQSIRAGDGSRVDASEFATRAQVNIARAREVSQREQNDKQLMDIQNEMLELQRENIRLQQQIAQNTNSRVATA